MTPAPRSTRRAALLATALLGLPVLCSCNLPRDPERTLERVRGGVLRVGAVHETPWVRMRPQGPPEGVEAALVEALAATLDAEIRWSYGGETRLMEALQRFELDLVIGGLEASSPYAGTVGFTRPYFVDADAQEHVLAAPPGENAWISFLEGFLREQDLPVLIAEQRLAERGAL